MRRYNEICCARQQESRPSLKSQKPSHVATLHIHWLAGYLVVLVACVLHALRLYSNGATPKYEVPSPFSESADYHEKLSDHANIYCILRPGNWDLS